MAAAEAKLSFDVAVDSVLDSLEPKFILKEVEVIFFLDACSPNFCRFTYVIWYNWYDWLRATNRRLW